MNTTPASNLPSTKPNIPVQVSPQHIGTSTVPSVAARDLHSFLESKQEFANWIKGRIEQYSFVEGQDFTVDKIIIGRATQIDYHITLDMAKELAMVERNAKGKEARQYFIECERRAKTQQFDPMQVLSDPEKMRGLLLVYTKKVLTLEALVAEQIPKVEAFDLLATGTEGSFCIRDAAKTLQVQETGFRQWLVKHSWVYVRPKSGKVLAFADRIKSGFMEHKITKNQVTGGMPWASTQARITTKGIAHLSRLFRTTHLLPA